MAQDNNNIEKIKEWILAASLLVMLVMAVLPLFTEATEWMRWGYAAGAGVTLLVRLTQRYPGKNIRIKRLYGMNVVAAVMYCISAALPFYNEGTSDWIALLMAGAVMQTYASFMIDKLSAKEQK